jgi:hypothetical protein
MSPFIGKTVHGELDLETGDAGEILKQRMKRASNIAIYEKKQNEVVIDVAM